MNTTGNQKKAISEEYDIHGIMNALEGKEEMDPDLHDGSYQMMRAVIEAYADLPDLSTVDYHDLNLVYLTTVGTWKHGIDAKKKTIDESHLKPDDKEYLKELWDEVWQKAVDGEFISAYMDDYDTQRIGMFGTGFFSFQNKTTAEDVRKFIGMCIDILPMEEDKDMFRRAESVFTGPFKGMQAASASMVLHCLKPFTFPILNTNMGFRNIFELLGVQLTRTYYLDAYINNCRKIRDFRNRNFSWRNYRIFDLAAHRTDKYIKKNSDPAKAAEEGKTTEEVRLETTVNARVREEFMQQIREKEKELEEVERKRLDLQKEIELLEGMLKRI